MKSDLAISIRNLGKAYTIRHNAPRHTTMAESIMHRLRHPLSRSGMRETFWALKDVNFDVTRGEVVGIIGRNGAGKSTLLKILSRITEPTTGEIDLFGRVGSLLEVGTGFHQELTGRENIFLNGAILGMTRGEIRKQFDAIVDFAGVEQFLDTPVKRYSSGMYVRLAFAVAAHLRSEILIVDEVLAVGDAEFQKKCLGKMKDVARRGRTVLFVSHNMSTVRRLCTTAISLQHGMIAAAGDVESCVRRYLDAQTAPEVIRNRVKLHGDAIVIESVRINDGDSTEVGLRSSDDTLTIEINGIARRAVDMSLEARITDAFGTPLAFFSPGHERGSPPRYQPGAFNLRHVIQLPRMNRGEYILHLYLTQPSVQFIAEILDAARIECDGAPTITGHTFDYANGAGWLLLEEAPEKSFV